jgi:hypothetical protein
VYAVGANGDGKGALMFHYDGARWTKIDTGVGDDLWWLHAVGPDEIRVVGKNGTILAYHPSSGKLEKRSAPMPKTLFGVWSASASDVWYVGGDPGASGAVYRDDGATIRSVMTASSAFFKVHGTSASDVWIVGEGGAAIHWNGTSFSRIATPTQTTLFTVHGASSDRLFAVGGFGDQGAIIAWNGTSWTSETPSPSTPAMNGVFALGDGSAYAGGYNGHIYVRSASSGSWSELSTRPSGKTMPITYYDVHSVWVDETGGIWAVGGRGLAGDPPTGGMLIHYGATIASP